MEGKTLFITGASGSLGGALIKKYLEKNKIICYSRDDQKHWNMTMKYKSNNLSFIMGDVRDYYRLEMAILRSKPDIIISAAAIKRVDSAESELEECMQTNLIGPMNICNCVERNIEVLKNLECVLQISTDKACSPISSYGSTKQLAEKFIIEKAYKNPNISFKCVRYGNIINSNMSIIPILHAHGKDPLIKNFTLTHQDMTRFYMTLEQSCDLIEHAILHADSGDIVVPTLVSMRVIDLFEIFGEIYNKEIKITGLRAGEKMLESLINETQSMSMIKSECGKYYYLKPFYKNICNAEQAMDYNSKINPLNKEQLREYLDTLGMLNKN